MIELALITRFAVDFFWDQKILSVIHSFAALLILLLVILVRKGSVSRPCWVDLCVLLLFLVIVQAFARRPSDDSTVEFAKFGAFILFYVFGRIVRPALAGLGALTFVSMGALGLLAISAALGIGYQQWGDVATFTGGYYFKADAALATLVFLSIICSYSRQTSVIVVASALAFFIVWTTNSRIALPIVLAVPVLSRMVVAGRVHGGVRTLIVLLFPMLVGVLLLAAVQTIAPNILGFDLVDPFSDGNTQGRSVLWLGLVQAFSSSALVDQLFGAGLSADQSASAYFSASDIVAGLRAHNSFLYVLLATGLAGLITLVWLLAEIYRAVVKAATLEAELLRRWAGVLSCLWLTFVVMSLTTEVLIRPQLMVPLFLTFGVVVTSTRGRRAVAIGGSRVQSYGRPY